ncbi:MAG TPA: prolipoprotein diacylglyceryl transferase family protein [Vicinamibacterales bacterium]|nr:prolipoprotein diacylglyceryl transferase family protein [Vicinamibacterales bacterium]
MYPVLLHLPFGIAVYSYGTALCASVVLGQALAIRLATRRGLDAADLQRCCFWALGGAFVGARLLYVVTNLQSFDSLAGALRWWDGGVVAYGGFLGGFAGAAAYCARHDVAFAEWIDCAAPSLALGLALTRVGCFLAGCDFGTPWNGAWAVRFPAGSPAFTQQVAQGLIPSTALQSLPVHPTQLYESIAGLTLLAVVAFVRRRRAFAGQAFATFALGYAIFRSAIEVVRADLDRGGFGMLSTSQWIAAATFCAVVAFWWTRDAHRLPA